MHARASHRRGQSLLYLGSSCIYLRDRTSADSRIVTCSAARWNRPTTPYAIAKIAGLKSCEAYRRQYGCNFISAMPTNLYGPGDNFDLPARTSSALIRKFHQAKVDGAGRRGSGGRAPQREFLHVDDLADAACSCWRTTTATTHQRRHWRGPLHSRPCRSDSLMSTRLRSRVRPVDARRHAAKLLDVSRLHGLGWRPRIPLDQGLRSTYEWFRAKC